MRRSLRSLFSVALCAAFLVESTGAADLGPALARGGFLPPPGALAPAALRPGAMKPAAVPARPAGESWLSSARVVARWTAAEAIPSVVAGLEDAAIALDALISAYAAPKAEADPAGDFAAFADAPPPPPDLLRDFAGQDRMMIAMNGRRVLASGPEVSIASLLQFRSELAPLRPRFEGAWKGSGPARARVDYLKPFGVTKGEAKGFRVKLSDGYSRLLPSRGGVPEGLKREIPLYFAGDEVEIEALVRNDSSEPLAGLRLAATQEKYDAFGRAGAAYSAPVERPIPDLAPGETAVVRWKIRLQTHGDEAVNFEQTHLRVLGKDPAGGEKVVLDEAQAGVVDPPGE